jgi:hypothetical protein
MRNAYRILYGRSAGLKLKSVSYIAVLLNAALMGYLMGENRLFLCYKAAALVAGLKGTPYMAKVIIYMTVLLKRNIRCEVVKWFYLRKYIAK